MTKRENQVLDEETRERMMQQVRLLAIMYRVLIIAGLVFFLAAVVVSLWTLQIFFWLFIVPLILIGAGIVLARIEYRLYERVYWDADLSGL
jgi:fatty acid desaturase